MSSLRKNYINIFRLLLNACLIYASSCQASHIVNNSPTDKDILTVFFRTLIEESEAGYVINNKKPLCLIGYQTTDDLLSLSSIHSFSVAIKEGLQIWNQVKCFSDDIYIHLYNRERPFKNRYEHILIINRPLFLKTVEEHLSIFQYVLGPAITPEFLLCALMNDSNNFYSILKYDKTLIGILLGYGIENSIYVKRIEDIQEALFSADIPPHKSHSTLLPSSLYAMKNGYLFLAPTYHEMSWKILIPSTGFSSISEEYESLASKISLPPDELLLKKPYYIFGHLKSDATKMKDTFADLIETQKMIQNNLNSKNFFNNMLLSFRSENIDSNSIKLKCDTENKNIHKIIARVIFKIIRENDDNYKKGFLDGLRNIPNQTINNSNIFQTITKKNLLEFQKNYKNADQFFEQLSNDLSYKSLIPSKLYYKIITSGYGKTLSDQSLVNLECAFFNPANKCLSDFRNMNTIEPYDLNSAMPAFAYALKGMKEGERREIFIHPSLAYGIYTFLEKGIYLKADVTLTKIFYKVIEEQPLLLPIPDDFSYLFDYEYKKIIDQNQKDEGNYLGSKIAKHFEKDLSINMGVVVNYLINIINESDPWYDLNEEEEQAINKLHWQIYFGSK